MTYVYGPSKIALKYSDEELHKIIGDYISNNEEFTYGQLCGNILSVAEQDDMLHTQPNTSYSHIILTHSDTIRICRELWNLIWAKEILLLFNDSQDIYRRNSETYFIVNK